MAARLALLAQVLAVCSALQLQPSRPLQTPCARPRTSGVFAGRKGRPSGQSGGMQGQGQQGPKGPPEDGSSLFYLYCRAERKDLWYPVSVLQSDSQAQGLILTLTLTPTLTLNPNSDPNPNLLTLTLTLTLTLRPHPNPKPKASP